MPTRLLIGDFAADVHAAKYQRELDAHPTAISHLLAILNDPANEQRLVDAELHGMPALAGVVRFVEGDEEIEPLLAEGAPRFRQTVGVAVKLKMARLGWSTTGRKGVVKGARHFTKAERYQPGSHGNADPVAQALATLEVVAAIGDEEERSRTGAELVEALAATRASEGRPF